MSQEELLEGIYQEPATLSRVENGQMPDRKKLRRLMERLGMSGWRYAGAVEQAQLIPKRHPLRLLMISQPQQLLCPAVSLLRLQLSLAKPVFDLQAFYPLPVLRNGQIHKPFHPLRCPCRLLMLMSAQKLLNLIIHQSQYHFLSEGLITDNMTLYMVHSDHMNQAEEWSAKNARRQLFNGKINTIHYVFSNLIGVEEGRAEKKAGGPVDFKTFFSYIVIQNIRLSGRKVHRSAGLFLRPALFPEKD